MTNLLPNLTILHEIGNSFLAILCKMGKLMFDAWGIRIFFFEESERMGENGYRKFNDKFTLRKFEESMVDILNDCLHS